MIMLGNLMSLVGCSLMVLIGFVRRRERVLTLQCFQFGFLAASNLLLGATSGFISGVVSILRNLVFPRVGGSVWLKLVFIAIQAVMTLMAGWAGPVSLLPLAAGVLFTWFIDTRSAVQLKLAIVAAQVLWGIYDLYYGNYVAFFFDVMTIVTNLISVAQLSREDPLLGKFHPAAKKKAAL